MRAVLVRDGDYFVPLRKRMEIAHEAHADFFMSIHADSYRDSSATGATVYVLNEKGASDEAALLLAQRENASDLIGGVSLADKDQMLARVLLDLSQNAALNASTAAGQRLDPPDVGGDTDAPDAGAAGAVPRAEVAGHSVRCSSRRPTSRIRARRRRCAVRSIRPRSPSRCAKESSTTSPRIRPQGSYFARHDGAAAAGAASVARGETLSEIAERYRVSTATLRRSNSLRRPTRSTSARC